MKKLPVILLFILLCALLPAARKALLIGNGAYSSRALKNPVNDATDLEAALKDLGFETTLVKNGDYAAMYRGIERFTDGLVYGDEAIFYFSGHGVQVQDVNYLIPVDDRKLTDKIDFDTYAISASWTLGKLAKARVSVMILDACRDNPVITKTLSVKKGLAKLEPETGSQYVIYATEKDTEAFDGDGRNSPFAESLLRHIKSPVSVGEPLLRLIRNDVKKATHNQQIPTAYGLLDEPYYLASANWVSENRVIQPEAQVIIHYGSILVGSNLDGDVWLDGKNHSRIPAGSQMRISNVQTGSHYVELRAGDKSDGRSISIRKDQESKIDFDFDLTPPGMVLVEGGSFMMGSNDGFDLEKPVHQVTVSSFYIGKYEVTQKEWWEVMSSNPSHFNGEDHRVENVSWYDAIDYCNQRSICEGLEPCYMIDKSKKDSNNTFADDELKWSVTVNWGANGYRLPTEAEWEFAASGGDKSKGYTFSGSNDIGSVAWCGDNSGNTTHPVGSKSANELGIYDTSGNVWEWCWDWHGKYSNDNSTNTKGAGKGSLRVLRGGSWINNDGCRVVNRGGGDPDRRYAYCGFRVSMALK